MKLRKTVFPESEQPPNVAQPNAAAIPARGAPSTLAEQWKEAQRRFEEKTQKPLKAGQEQQSLDDVMQKLDGEAQEGHDNVKHPHLRRVVQDVLNCIKLLGGIAAQAASVVFSPASLCFNAVSFLLDAHARVNAVYDGLAKLFEKVLEQLQVFRIYQKIEIFTTVDEELVKASHKVMIHFVDVCAHAFIIVNGTTWQNVKTTLAAALLDDDGGVGSELMKFEELMVHQGRINDATTLQHVLESQNLIDKLQKASKETTAKVDHILKDVSGLTEDMEQDRRIDRIKLKLGFEGQDVSEMDHVKNEDAITPISGTGAWLQDRQVYQEWTNPEPRQKKLLIISGKPYSGKTYLCFHVYRYLKSRDALVARYNFKFRALDRTDDEKLTHTWAVTAIQLAQQDRSFAKALLAGLESREIKSSKDLYEVLKASCSQVRSTCYMIFDGFDMSPSDPPSDPPNLRTALFKMLKTLSEAGVAVSCTGTTASFIHVSDLVADFEGMWRLRLLPHLERLSQISIINMEEGNQADIVLFIKDRQVKKKLLEVEDSEAASIIQQTLTKLPDHVDGDFSIVRQVLDVVCDAVVTDSLDTIKGLLQDGIATNTLALTEKRLKLICASLSVGEVEQLNTLLAWLIYRADSRPCVSLKFLSAALILHTGKPLLLPLEARIEEKYTGILRIDQGGEVWVDEKIAAFLKADDSPRIPVKSKNHEPKLSLTMSIDKGDSSEIRQILGNIGQIAASNTFPFDNATIGRKNEKEIRAHPVESEFLIAKDCLRLLLDRPQTTTKPLVPYAIEFLCDHLDNLNKVQDHFEAAELQELGKGLLKLFSDIHSLERHWENIGERGPPPFLLQYTIIWTWLHEHIEEADLTNDHERSWLSAVTNNDQCKISVLKEVASMVSRKWLYDEDGWLMPNQEWLQEYLIKSEEETTEDRTTTESLDWLVRWTLKENKDREQDAVWFTRLATTYAMKWEPRAACRWLERARALSNSSWKSKILVGRRIKNCAEHCANGLSDPKSAEILNRIWTHEIEGAINILQEKRNLDEAERDALKESLKFLVNWHIEQGELEAAVDLLHQARSWSPEDQEVNENLLTILLELRRHEAASLMETMDLNAQDGFRIGPLAGALSRLERTEAFEFFHKLIFTFHEKPLMSAILKSIRDVAKIRISQPEHLILLRYCGEALAQYGRGQASEAIEVWQRGWSIGLELGKEGDGETMGAIATHLSNFHYDHAVSAKNTGQYSKVELHLDAIRTLAEEYEQSTAESASAPHAILASFHARYGEDAEARSVVRQDLIEAMQNNGVGAIAGLCLYSGDHLNAQIGFRWWQALNDESCAGSDQNPEASDQHGTEHAGKTEWFCSGVCGKVIWPSFWCQTCPFIAFEEECMGKLKNGMLEKYVCSQNHQWLRVPVRQQLGRDHRSDQARSNNKFAPIAQWLDALARSWGIEDSRREITEGPTEDVEDANEPAHAGSLISPAETNIGDGGTEEQFINSSNIWDKDCIESLPEKFNPAAFFKFNVAPIDEDD